MIRVGMGILIVACLAFAGCSGSAGNSPILPSDPGAQTSAPPTGRSLWGMFDIMIDPSSDVPVLIAPIRSPRFHLNIRKYLEESPCSDCLTACNFQITPSGFNLDLAITHPFDDVSLCGFDVRGIMFFDGSHAFPKLDIIAPSRLKGEAYLVKPDGYSTLFNPTDYPGNTILSYSKGSLIPPGMPAPSATLGAFNAFFSDGQSEDAGGRRAFFPGDTISRRYEIKTPVSGPFRFGYVIDCSWDSPVAMPPNNIDDFPISANCLEPYRIDIDEIENSISSFDGSVVLHVTAFDHQGTGGILECRAEAPGLTDLLITDDSPVIIDSNAVLFELEIPNNIGMADVSGEEILIEIIHEDPDPNLGLISGWAFTIVNVENVPANPVIDFITPDTGKPGELIDATIHGAGFLENAEVQLYKGLSVIPGFNIEIESHHVIHLQFALSGPTGSYTLLVENPNGHWAELHDAFEILKP